MWLNQEWRELRNKVHREVEKAKKACHTSRIRGLQKSEPRKWHTEIIIIIKKKKVTKSTKMDLKLDALCVDHEDEKGKANATNDMFTSVSAGIPSLNYAELPAYLPVQDPPPHLYPWEAYAELKKVNPTKSGGPDMIPAKIIKEFAYELSLPLYQNWYSNSSFAEGKVPTQWKNGIVVPIPNRVLLVWIS